MLTSDAESSQHGHQINLNSFEVQLEMKRDLEVIERMKKEKNLAKRVLT
jgi:hypothetical protein